MHSIQIEDYISNKEKHPILDVRSPKEYSKGHIPGAMNLPLFDNDERAEIGTLYKQVSKEKAMSRGLEIAGKKLKWYVDQSKALTKSKKVVVHCWRGGMRSSSIATLLNFMGWDTSTIIGGYKAYRRYVLNSFESDKLKIIVLGGKTGSGKTILLKSLRELGEQTIDLEKLANHKGSAFGALGEQPQPTVEQFENDLFEDFVKLNKSKRVWIENESKSIGRVFVPDGLWGQMTTATYLGIDVPFEERVEMLVEEYGHFPKEDLIESFRKIQKRMGGQHVKAAVEAIESGDIRTATSIALLYYDKSYAHAAGKKPFSQKMSIKASNKNHDLTAKELIKIADEHIS